MTSRIERPTFEDPDLQREIMDLRRVDNFTNLLYLAMEYACLAADRRRAPSSSPSLAHRGKSRGRGMSRCSRWRSILVGAIQHRLAGLGHEASHYSFMKNRVLNDLVPDVFCMFPLMTTVHFYRLFHMAHHQYHERSRARSGLAEPGTWEAVRRVSHVSRPVHAGDLLRLAGRSDPVLAVSVGLLPGEYAGTGAERLRRGARGDAVEYAAHSRGWERRWGSPMSPPSTS